MITFFIFHYGLFWTVHGVFVFVLFGLTFSETRGGFEAAGVAIAAASLFLSHGVSYFVNFLGKDEYLMISPDRQMFESYPRVVVLHLTILAGGFLAGYLGAPLVALAVLVVLKTTIDLWAHVREHRKAENRSDPASAGSAGG